MYGNRYSPLVILNGSCSPSPLYKVQYQEKTAPLIGFYEKEGLVLSVEATSSDAVIDAVKKELSL